MVNNPAVPLVKPLFWLGIITLISTSGAASLDVFTVLLVFLTATVYWSRALPLGPLYQKLNSRPAFTHFWKSNWMPLILSVLLGRTG